MRAKLDEETLKGISRTTQVEYFYAGTAANLKKVYETLNSRLAIGKKETGISGLPTRVAAALARVSASLSLRWFNQLL
jgi:Ca-activated chloride channel family protein